MRQVEFFAQVADGTPSRVILAMRCEDGDRKGIQMYIDSRDQLTKVIGALVELRDETWPDGAS